MDCKADSIGQPVSSAVPEVFAREDCIQNILACLPSKQYFRLGCINQRIKAEYLCGDSSKHTSLQQAMSTTGALQYAIECGLLIIHKYSVSQKHFRFSSNFQCDYSCSCLQNKSIQML